MIFLRKIVIFHTKYTKNVRASLRSALFFLSAPPPNLKSWIRPCTLTVFSVCQSIYKDGNHEYHDSIDNDHTLVNTHK